MVGDRRGERPFHGEDLHRFLRTNRAERAAVELRATTLRGRPLLAGPEVVHVAEHDVPHRRALGDRNREAEVPQSPLGVHRPVDRVDHDVQLGGAERALAELLRDERELVPVPMELLEPSDDGPLGGIVDRRRVVAALAGCDDGLPLDPGRKLVQHARDVLRRGAKGVEPGLH